MRPGVLRNLRWKDVGLTTRVIKLYEFKCRRRRADGLRLRLVPLDRVVTRLLVNLKRNRRPGPDDVVCPNRVGRMLTHNAVRIGVHRACERAGIDQHGERLVAYSIRHTAATTATRNGVRDRPLADIMGHTDTRTTARYQHLDGADLVAVIDRATAKPGRRAA